MKKFYTRRMFIGISIVILLLSIFAYGIYMKYFNEERLDISYKEFIESIEEKQVKIIYYSDAPKLKGQFYSGQLFRTDNPRNENFKEFLLMNDVEVEEINEQYTVGNIASFVLLIGVFIGLAVFFSRQNSTQVSKEYDKMSTIEITAHKDRTINFDSIAGNQEAKENIMELVDFLKNPEKYSRYGARMPQGVILYGPPGTGKTLMAKALANEAGVDFIAVSGSDFVQIYAGIGAARIRSIFKKANEKGKCVIFIDEIDAIGKKRDRTGLGGSDESDRTLNALLTEMSGFKGNEGIVVLAATNRLDTLDEALLRPGRFDRQIEIGLPDLKARHEILKLYSMNRPIGNNVDLENLAQQTVYFSGADLENLMNEAAIYAARENAEYIGERHIDKAFYKVIAGEEKKDRSTINQLDREITAYHEAGHTLATKLLCPNHKVTKVTIIPSTKGAGGFSMNIPPDKMYYTKKDMLHNIKIALAGRIAEELVFGQDKVTTGASNDIQKATEIMMRMIKQFGMDEEMGMINYDVLWGSQGGYDEELRKICKRKMVKLYEETKLLMKENITLIHKIAKELLMKETLSESQIDSIMNEIY